MRLLKLAWLRESVSVCVDSPFSLDRFPATAPDLTPKRGLNHNGGWRKCETLVLDATFTVSAFGNLGLRRENPLASTPV